MYVYDNDPLCCDSFNKWLSVSEHLPNNICIPCVTEQFNVQAFET